MLLYLSGTPDWGFREVAEKEEDIRGQTSSYTAIHGGRVKFAEEKVYIGIIYQAKLRLDRPNFKNEIP